ncbi:MAG: hypothetical protein JOZ72_15165 [Alphaproteobacteria bacterium]|nr:hypothetical protein [Alphaproteobacteria bacterium]
MLRRKLLFYLFYAMVAGVVALVVARALLQYAGAGAVTTAKIDTLLTAAVIVVFVIGLIVRLLLALPVFRDPKTFVIDRYKRLRLPMGVLVGSLFALFGLLVMAGFAAGLLIRDPRTLMLVLNLLPLVLIAGYLVWFLRRLKRSDAERRANGPDVF